ncbi:F-box protein SKIP31-like isoform X1 [Chenopodium quinoa]|uniref:F-box protein SKIP31-like isoform X1 n=1 Tax=Chenopodium quinoa TaxID=63459 RepID=UPI000B799A7A|nr:F-box protein SKIP31-like isoform X1 [Chenopodium quinoa]
MSNLDEEEENLAQFLESEVLSEVSDQDEDTNDTERPMKRPRTEDIIRETENDACDIDGDSGSKAESSSCSTGAGIIGGLRIETGILSKIPPELFQHVLKFLSSEDLISCSRVCKFLNHAASEESLWRRLYCLRWGLLPPTRNLRDCAWKKLYIQRDEEDMVQSVTNCQPEFKEYYLQMYAAKRSQAPLLSQVNDDLIILDKTVADQVSMWKNSRGLGDKVVTDHTCSGEVCSFFQIGNVFICEKTGNVHVCDDTCKEAIADPANELLVCTISGRCFDRLLSPSEVEGDGDQEQQQDVVADEAEPFMGAGRFARAYLLGYNCDDEKELEAALRFC